MEPVLHVRALQDNYIWLIRGHSRTHTAIVDPGEAAPVLAALTSLGLSPVAILCTHHHHDHTDGIAELLEHFPGLPVYGSKQDQIEGLTHPVTEQDTVVLDELGLQLQVLHIPGHTHGHLAYYGHGWLFSGDTLFSAGCGRLFEGTAAQMHASLDRLATLPDTTLVYCGHEYTLANLRFALTVEPENAAALTYQKAALAKETAGKPTLPSNIGLERAINPFLRCGQATVRIAAENHCGQDLPDSLAVFACVRRWKDSFRG